jgi:hypothetical protein
MRNRFSWKQPGTSAARLRAAVERPEAAAARLKWVEGVRFVEANCRIRLTCRTHLCRAVHPMYILTRAVLRSA